MSSIMEPEPLTMFLRRARRICDLLTDLTEFVEEYAPFSSGKKVRVPRVEVQHLILLPSQVP